jgi:hypothetical protein
MTIPKFNAIVAVRAITQADSRTALELAWFAIKSDYEMNGRVIEPEIIEAYAVQGAMLADVDAIAFAVAP